MGRKSGNLRLKMKDQYNVITIVYPYVLCDSQYDNITASESVNIAMRVMIFTIATSDTVRSPHERSEVYRSIVYRYYTRIT